MTTWSPPGAEDPFVGLNPVPPVADLPDELPQRRPGFWARFVRQRWALVGLTFLVLIILAAIFAPVVAPHPPNAQDINAINNGPSGSHWLGTDDLGRDILSRIIWGARISLRAAFEIVALAAVIAVPLGLIAGFFRGAVDAVIMRIMDALFSFPPLILALTVAALLGADINDAAIAIAIVFVPSFVRLLRGEVIAVREEAFIESARSLGATSKRLMGRHVVPNVASPIIIQLALALGFALLAEAGLSFLGIGEQPPTPSWGGMLQEGFNFINSSPWALVFPGLAIMLTVLSFNLVADGLRDSLGRDRPPGSTLVRGDKEEGRTPMARLRSIGRAETPPPAARHGAALLAVQGLKVEFVTRGQWLPVMEEGAFSLQRGQTLGLVGESGSGKTVSALAVMGLLPPRVSRVSGSIRFEGRELTTLSPSGLRQLRGSEIAMIFQEPMTSLNPAYTVGNQIAEQVRAHREITRKEAWNVAVDMLERVEIPQAAGRAHDYPHAFSGGMRQRVMIAMALSCSPKLLIADEPTTALDVTTQAQIIDLLHTLQREEAMAMIFVTHDLGVIADVADDVVVMYAGQIVEQSIAADIFVHPRHPYTEALLDSVPQLTPRGEPLHAIPGMVPRPDQFLTGCRFAPRCTYAEDGCLSAPVPLRRPQPVEGPTGNGAVGDSGPPPSSPVILSRCARRDELTLSGARLEVAATSFVSEAAKISVDPVMTVTDLVKEFPIRSGVLRRKTGAVRAVDGVDLTVMAGTTLGLVGESGSGKSTLARLVLRLIDPTSGDVVVDGKDITKLGGPALRRHREAMQMVFQDPYSSLDPRQSIADIVGEPLAIHTSMSRSEREKRVADLLGQVGLGSYVMQRQPHEFSGGQRQRIAIARALALQPRLLVCDEPVSALDVSTQSQVINLFSRLQKELGLAYLFIAHDLSVVRHISDRIAVMYLGKIVEEGEADEVYLRPTHPYTAALLSAIPVPDPTRRREGSRIILSGEVGEPVGGTGGCRFRARCPFAMEICASVDPEAFVTPGGSTVRCHLHTTGPALGGASVQLLPTPTSATKGVSVEAVGEAPTA
ncbi:MAG TPA: dipeptide ABC transporter ATP-binding protein [Acidimicrobiales bacterium]